MLPNNEVRVPPPRVVAHSAVPRDITADFTEAASSKSLTLHKRADLIVFFYRRIEHRPARQR